MNLMARNVDDTRELRIVSAAIRYGGRIYTGKRHGDIMVAILDDYPTAMIAPDDKVFLASDGTALNRFQAGAVAFAAGQTRERKQRLLSEHLW